MSALQPKMFLCHEWEADRCLHHVSSRGAVNVASHLWGIGLGPDARSTRVGTSVPSVRFRRARPWTGCHGFVRGQVPSG